MNERIKVNFYLNTYRKDKAEQSPIMCRLVQQKEIKQFSIGVKCKKENWDKTSKK